MSKVILAGSFPNYEVSSPPKDGRQRKKWVMEHTIDGSTDTGIALADWSYGNSSYATIEEAVAVGLRAKAMFPNRRFRVDRDLDGSHYEQVMEVE